MAYGDGRQSKPLNQNTFWLYSAAGFGPVSSLLQGLISALSRTSVACPRPLSVTMPAGFRFAPICLIGQAMKKFGETCFELNREAYGETN